MEFTHGILCGVILMDPLISLKEIKEIEQNDDCWRIGVIEISKHQPLFCPLLMGFSSGFTPTSRFHLMEYHVIENDLQGIAIIFRQFDHPNPIYFDEYGDEPDEYFVGWTSLERMEEAKKWVLSLNGIIAKKLHFGG